MKGLENSRDGVLLLKGPRRMGDSRLVFWGFAAVDGEVYRELGGGELETVTCGVNVVWGEGALRCRIADDVSSTCLGWAERGLVYFSTWIC